MPDWTYRLPSPALLWINTAILVIASIVFQLDTQCGNQKLSRDGQLRIDA